MGLKDSVSFTIFLVYLPWYHTAALEVRVGTDECKGGNSNNMGS